MSSAQNQKSNLNQSLSFEDVSKLFSLPLSEAADILGVSTSVLKKICNENGLERWPHRKYLAGKSIEEIKKEAAKEKSKALGGISQKNGVATGPAASSSPGSHVKDNKTSKSSPEISKPQGTAQQPGSRATYTWRSHHILASGLAVETHTFDEFNHGFPSSGLSRSTNRWWGSGTGGDDGGSEEVKEASEGKANSMMGDSGCDKQDEVSLSNVRKRALEEGRKALNLVGVKKYGAGKLGKEEKILLRRLFQTS